MKKTIIPSKHYFILAILAFPMSLFLIANWPEMGMFSPVEMVIDAFKLNGVIGPFLLVFMALIWFCGYTGTCFISAFCAIYMFLLSSRPIRFSDDMISLGYIKKDLYRKDDITGIEIAPLASDNPMEQALCKTMGIYIAFGDYRKEDMRKYGILNVYQQVELSKKIPKAVKFINRMTSNKTFQKYAPGVSDASGVQVFDGMLWMTYTEENFRFLRNWLGSKYYDIDYPIAGESTQSKPE